MIRTIAQKEFRTALRDKRFAILGGIIIVLLLCAVITGMYAFDVEQKERQVAQITADGDFKNQPDRHPHRVAHYGSYAFRPKSTLSFLDFGLDSFTGTMVYLEAHQQNSANFSMAQQSGGLLRFGELTVAFVLQWLIPLLIIFLCFNAFTTEREEGTLKLLLSQGISQKQIASGKIFGYSRVLALIILPSLLLISIFLLTTQDFNWTTDLSMRIAILMSSYLAYFFIFICGSVLVSAFSKHSRTALLTLLGIWIFCCVLLPKATANLGAALYEAPSKAAMDAEVHHEAKEGIDGHNSQNERTAAFKEKLLKKYAQDDLGKLPVNIDGLVMAEGEAYSSKVYQAHFESLVSIYQKQDQFSILASWINPYLAIRYVSMAAAGTDYAHYIHFLNAAEQYRYELAQHLNHLQATKLGYKDKESRLTADHWKDYPTFNYKAPSASWALTQQLIPLLALFSWALLIYFICIYAIRNLKNI